MATSDKSKLESTARPAVLVRRSDLPVPHSHPARSFFGGLPKLPLEFDWPRAGVRAGEGTEIAALTFVAQIDLSEVAKAEKRLPLPQTGTLYFFCSSIFEGEGNPPCRVLYYSGSATQLPERTPPSDLMPLAGRDGDYQVKWLDPEEDLRSKVEFKYPITFLPFRDFEFQNDPVGGKLLIDSLRKALGPGTADKGSIYSRHTADDYAKDPDWPFDWLLITYAVRAVLCSVDDVEIEATGNEWLERAERSPPLADIAAETKESFRAWWVNVVHKCQLKRPVSVYARSFADDLRNAINHTIRCMATHGEQALARAPLKYVETLKEQNQWKHPTLEDGQSRFFSTAVDQISGYGSSAQDAPVDYRDDVLLLQVQGDDAFFDWHTNCGCMLHFWIDRDALSKLDFSGVEATLECD